MPGASGRSGTVTRLSADAFADEAARQACIRTRDRSPFADLLQPLVIHFDRAVRETCEGTTPLMRAAMRAVS